MIISGKVYSSMMLTDSFDCLIVCLFLSGCERVLCGSIREIEVGERSNKVSLSLLPSFTRFCDQSFSRSIGE